MLDMTLPITVDPGGGEPFGPDNTPYDAAGGEAGVLALVNAFYDHMDANDAYSVLRGLHAPDLANARTKLFEFLSGWLGGPQLFIAKHGHPRLRRRHAPFSIGEVERDQWISCMDDAMNERGIDGQLRVFLTARFAHTADFMRNR